MRQHSIAIALLLVLLAANAAALDAPPNWSAKARDGESLEAWAKQFANADAPPPGR